MNGAGDVVALEGSQLVQYAPGSSSGTVLDSSVQSFGLQYGNIIALDKESGIGNVVMFVAGSTVREVLDANSVTEMMLSGPNVVVLELPSPSAAWGSLYYFVAKPNPSKILLDSNVSNFFTDKYGAVIAEDLAPPTPTGGNTVSGSFGNNGIYYADNPQPSTQVRLVAFSPTTGYTLSPMVDWLEQLTELPDGTNTCKMLAKPH